MRKLFAMVPLFVVALALAGFQNYPYAPPSPTSGGGGGIAPRQACTIVNDSTNVSTFNVSCGTTTAGDALFIPVIIYGGSAVGTTCSDGTNTYVFNVGSVGTQGFCLALNIAGGSVTVTVTLPAAHGVIGGGFEFSGVATASAVDGATNNNNANAANTAQSCPAVTTTTANDVVICFAGNISVNGTYTEGSGYTIPSSNGQVSGGNQSGMMEFQVVTTPTSYTPAFAIGTSIASDVFTVALKP